MSKTLLLILEGPDRSGKGTFISVCRDIIPTSQLVTLHSAKPPSSITKYISNPGEKASVIAEWSYEYYINLARSIKALSELNNVIILDRSYLGEFVYGPLYRNAKYTEEDFYNLENEFLNEARIANESENVFLINFTDSAEKLIARDDGLSHTSSIDFKNKELESFKHLFEISAIENKIELDWSSTNFSEDTCAAVITHIALSCL